MKKEFILISILLMLTISLILAEKPTDKEEVEKSGENILEKQNEILSKEIKVPEKIEGPIKIIFGLKEQDKLNMQLLIILLCLWLFFLLIFHNIVQLIETDKTSKWIGALIPTLILSATGAIRSAAIPIINISEFFTILEKLGPLTLGIGIITIIASYYILNIIIGIIKESLILGRAVSDGIKAGAQIAKLKAMAEIEEAANKR
jgi:hypothetical protein